MVLVGGENRWDGVVLILRDEKELLPRGMMMMMMVIILIILIILVIHNSSMTTRCVSAHRCGRWYMDVVQFYQPEERCKNETIIKLCCFCLYSQSTRITRVVVVFL